MVDEAAGSQLVELELDDGLAILTLNRPDRGNALCIPLLEQLCDHLGRLQAPPGRDRVRAIVLTGAGERHFSTGYDLEELRREVAAGPSVLDPVHPFERAVELLRRIPIPVIASINGTAYGGGLELCCSCDLRLGHPGVQLAMPPARLGIVYSESGLRRFVALCGLAATQDLFFTGRRLGAAEALRLGILQRVVPAPELRSETMALARRLMAGAPRSHAGHKRLLEMLCDAALTADQQAAIDRIRRGAFASADLREGIEAASEGRSPRFRGE